MTLLHVPQSSDTARAFHHWLSLNYFLAVSLSCSFLILYSLAGEGMLKRLFSWRPLRYLGNMSYSYYLSHVLTLKGLAYLSYRVVPPSHTSSMLFSFIASAAFLGTVFTSTMLFHFVEMPYSILTATSNRISPVLQNPMNYVRQ